jgi:hypothetical protein
METQEGDYEDEIEGKNNPVNQPVNRKPKDQEIDYDECLACQ